MLNESSKKRDHAMTLLRGKKVHLRPPEPDDLKLLFKWFNDHEASGGLDVFQVTSWAEVEKDFKEPKDFTMLLVIKNKDESKIGLVVHYFSHFVMRNIEIGFMIAEAKERNKGYITEAAKLMVDYLFTTQNISRVQATTNVLNKPAQRVLEKIGFKKEGQLREALFTAGKFHDVYVYGITRKEWKG
jgi:RimJ/RimL family protein N-acetyltransferase